MGDVIYVDFENNKENYDFEHAKHFYRNYMSVKNFELENKIIPDSATILTLEEWWQAFLSNPPYYAWQVRKCRKATIEDL